MPLIAKTVVLLVFSNIFIMKEPVRLNYLWAGLCLCGAVFFVFRR